MPSSSGSSSSRFEDEGIAFLLNITTSPTTQRQISGDLNLQQHRFENLKSRYVQSLFSQKVTYSTPQSEKIFCFRIPVLDFNFQRRKRQAKENHVLADDNVDYEKDFEFDLGSILGEDLYCSIVDRLDTACMEHSMLELWKFNEQKIHSLTEEKIIKALNRTTVR
jgi:hypothetical protein